MRIHTIGVVANIEKPPVADCLKEILQWARATGIVVLMERELAQKFGMGQGRTIDEIKKQIELIVVIGGDGTLLHTARLIKEMPLPILGINLGHFGYLTEVNLTEMTTALDQVIDGNFITESRMMLDVTINTQRDIIPTCSVLNDAVINRGSLSRMVSLETFVDGQFLATYRADGLIVSTPTGSTAYSLSAGGPIVLPTQRLIILNPICPHTLTNRPIILPAASKVLITLWTKEKGATVTLDGQESFTIESGDSVEVCMSPFVTNLVASPHRNYLEILRSKLGWGSAPSTSTS